VSARGKEPQDPLILANISCRSDRKEDSHGSNAASGAADELAVATKCRIVVEGRNRRSGRRTDPARRRQFARGNVLTLSVQISYYLRVRNTHHLLHTTYSRNELGPPGRHPAHTRRLG
jgi:hypothetical protein